MKTLNVLFLFLLCISFPSQGFSQLITLSGFVKDQSTGEMKKNATVYESISGTGTITNSEGYYRLLLSPGQKKLEISCPGYYMNTSAFTLTADTVISPELVPRELTNEKPISLKEHDFEPFNENGSTGNSEKHYK